MKQKQDLQQMGYSIFTGKIVFTEFSCTQKQKPVIPNI